MKSKTCVLLFFALTAFVLGCGTPANNGGSADSDTARDGASPAWSVDLPGGSKGVGFDDLRYSAASHRIVASAGGSGNVDLVDAVTLAVTAMPGFDPSVESADEGGGWIFAVDRAHGTLHVVDPSTKAVVASAACNDRPDYVRYSSVTNEIWVTEPGAGRIEVFTLPASGTPSPVRAGSIVVQNGPEGLVFDVARKRAYAHQYSSTIVAIDVMLRAVVATWPTGCGSSHGIPTVDERRGFVFAGCADKAKVVVLDADHDGKELGTYTAGSGETILAYAPNLGHLYLRGDPSPTVSILGVSAQGVPSLLATTSTSMVGHCMVADDRGHVWVCDARGGRLLRFQDTAPAITP